MTRLLAIFLLLSPTLAWAQLMNSLKGFVTDPSAASVPGAIVRILQPGGREQRRTADANGGYEFRNIPAGKYAIRVDKPGFAQYVVEEIQVNGASTFNIQLALDAQQQIVNVQSETLGVSTDPLSNANALVLKAEDLEALSDDPDTLQDELMALAGPAAGPNGGQIYIDGFAGGKLPPKSSIREVRINRNPYSAEFDRIGFGRIEILTRPGTDKFRGDVHYGISDSALNSRNPFSPNRAPFRSQLWGGRLSGPINKKTSFALDIEGRNVTENAIVNATILNSALQPTPLQQTILTPQFRFNVTGRIDYAINQNNTLVARYGFTPTNNDNQGVGQYSLLSRAFNSTERDHSVQITETAVLSTKAINETRFQFLRANSQALGNNTIPALSVSESFTSGGPQNGTSQTLINSFELSNITTYVQGAHSFKVGGRLRRSNQDSSAPNNFGGTFNFAGAPGPVLDANNNPVLGPDGLPGQSLLTSLERYRRTLLFGQLGFSPAQIRALGGGATQFTLNGGNPFASVAQADVGLFLAWDWRASQKLTVSGGLRWEDQTNISNHNNFAPRIGIAWALDGNKTKPTKTVLRFGTGMFYDRIDDNLTLNALRFNGVNQVSYVVRNPDFYPNIPPATHSLPSVPPPKPFGNFTPASARPTCSKPPSPLSASCRATPTSRSPTSSPAASIRCSPATSIRRSTGASAPSAMSAICSSRKPSASLAKTS